MPGKIYGRVLHERMMEITDKRVGDEQGGFWKGRGCMNQIFTVEILMEKYHEKYRKRFAAFSLLYPQYGRLLVRLCPSICLSVCLLPFFNSETTIASETKTDMIKERCETSS